MRAGVIFAALLALGAIAQPPEDEFLLPSFPTDAGVAAPPSPPPTPPLDPAPREGRQAAGTPSRPPLPGPPTLVAPEPRGPASTPSRRAGPPGAPPPATAWVTGTGAITGVLSGWRDYSAGLELFGGLVLGPAPSGDEPSGWLVVPGLEVLWSRLSGPICGGSAFCGQRWGGGAGLRVGHAMGLVRPDGIVRLRRFLFGGLSAQGAFVEVPPAPLSGGSRWGEAVFRLRGGAQLLATGGRADASKSQLVVHLSGHVEYVAFSPQGSGPQIGVSLGLAF